MSIQLLIKNDMHKYKVSVFHFENYEGSRILMCSAFSINPLDSLDEVVQWINSLHCEHPDFIQISHINCGCLFDTEDTRISNNVFYCNKH